MSKDAGPGEDRVRSMSDEELADFLEGLSRGIGHPAHTLLKEAARRIARPPEADGAEALVQETASEIMDAFWSYGPDREARKDVVRILLRALSTPSEPIGVVTDTNTRAVMLAPSEPREDDDE